MAGESMFTLACIILEDGCPPDNSMYMCNHGEEPEADCKECWYTYLRWAANGYGLRYVPYAYDKAKEDVEVHGHIFNERIS